jgi:predicted transcriptional regulator
MKDQIAEIVAAYVGNNSVPADQLPDLIATVSDALSGLEQSSAISVPEILKPAVPIRRSFSPNAITCLNCGWSGQMLRRHLTTAHGMNPDAYRERWKLPLDYPMTAKNYAARRSALAKQFGLGKQTGKRSTKG